MPVIADTPARQESVWDYPLWPEARPCTERIQVVLNGFVVADSDRTVRLLRYGSAPEYLFPAEDVRLEYLEHVGGDEEDDEMGRTCLYDVRVDEQVVRGGAWHYPEAPSGLEWVTERIGFDAARMDAALVDGVAANAAPDGRRGWVAGYVIGLSRGYPAALDEGAGVTR